jgi:hypothetical protein
VIKVSTGEHDNRLRGAIDPCVWVVLMPMVGRVGGMVGNHRLTLSHCSSLPFTPLRGRVITLLNTFSGATLLLVCLFGLPGGPV